MEEHKKDENSALFKHSKEIGFEIDDKNFEVIDKAIHNLKLSYKEMLHLRKSKPIFNSQENSEIFTLIFRNVQLNNSVTRDVEKYTNQNKHQRYYTKKLSFCNISSAVFLLF